MTAPLLYNGTPMDLAPVNITMAYLIERLRKNRWATHVILEPGDSTRYALLLVPYNNLLWVIRTETSGAPWSDAIGAVPLNCYAPISLHDVSALSRGNDWTTRVLYAFLAPLLPQITATATEDDA